MDIFVAEIYDYSYSVPMMVGLYDTEEKAMDAIQIVVDRCRNSKSKNFPEGRFLPSINRVPMNGFAPAIMDWLGNEVEELA